MRVCAADTRTIPYPGKDFIKEEVDPDKARDAFSKLYNMEHIQEVLDDLEAIIIEATQEGRDPADILADQHMVFVGPPGTGKTTVRFSMASGEWRVAAYVMGHGCISATTRDGRLVSRQRLRLRRRALPLAPGSWLSRRCLHLPSGPAFCLAASCVAGSRAAGSRAAGPEGCPLPC